MLIQYDRYSRIGHKIVSLQHVYFVFFPSCMNSHSWKSTVFINRLHQTFSSPKQKCAKLVWHVNWQNILKVLWNIIASLLRYVLMYKCTFLLLIIFSWRKYYSDPSRWNGTYIKYTTLEIFPQCTGLVAATFSLVG